MQGCWTRSCEAEPAWAGAHVLRSHSITDTELGWREQHSPSAKPGGQMGSYLPAWVSTTRGAPYGVSRHEKTLKKRSKQTIVTCFWLRA